MWTQLEIGQYVAWFIETKSHDQVLRNFRTQCGREPPSRPTLRAWYKSFIETAGILSSLESIVSKFVNPFSIEPNPSVKLATVSVEASIVEKSSFLMPH
ncbi:hypothetical protein AVEN_151995-1 [Araneus ventricosus]|uniref:Uncharacterized protein n=1 Tax=Araneus ventricosus TaxID=182803 RepID=A0A4Y2VR62_ARAVE|nr:hypothetical protein AVEN_151995-1 [Araneus ventricosus]